MRALIIRFDNCVAIDAPHSKDFIARFKHDIPSEYRMWHPTHSVWASWAPYVSMGVALAHDCYDPVTSPRITEVVEVFVKGISVKPPPRSKTEGTFDLTWDDAWSFWQENKDQYIQDFEDKKRKEQSRKHTTGGNQHTTGGSQGKGSGFGWNEEDVNDFFRNFDQRFGQQNQGYQRPSDRPPPPNGAGTSTGDYRVLFVTNDAPPEVITAAYRALAKLHHSDSGGSDERMKVINVAYDRIKKGW